MESNEIAERLFAELASAARKRHESGAELVPAKDFEQFILAVEKVSQFGVELLKEVPDIRHVGMALNYYNAAIKYALDEQREMAEALNVAG